MQGPIPLLNNTKMKQRQVGNWFLGNSLLGDKTRSLLKQLNKQEQHMPTNTFRHLACQDDVMMS